MTYVDNLGNEVGAFLSDGFALRYVQSVDIWISLAISPTGFLVYPSSPVAETFFESTDCSGTAYALFGDDGFVKGHWVFNGFFYYTKEARQERTYLSKFVAASNSCSQVGVGAPSVSAASVMSLPISDFGLTPPFKLVR